MDACAKISDKVSYLMLWLSVNKSEQAYFEETHINSVVLHQAVSQITCG